LKGDHKNPKKKKAETAQCKGGNRGIRGGICRRISRRLPGDEQSKKWGGKKHITRPTTADVYLLTELGIENEKKDAT